MKTTPTLADQIAELEAEHAAKVAKLLAESEVREALETATGLEPRTVSFYSLYGREASAVFGDAHYSNPFATLADALKLAEAFPLVPRLLRKDGCTSFPGETWFDAEKDRRGEVRSVAPFFLEADFTCTPQHGHTPKVELTWWAEIAGRVVELSVVLPPHEVCRGSFTKQNQTNKNARIISTELQFQKGWAAPGGNRFPVLHHQIGGDDTERMEMIRWGRGSDDCGHNFTFYSECYDADLPHYIRRLIELTATPAA